MASSSGYLALIADPALREDVDRVCAATGTPVVHASEPSSRKVWTEATAVVLDLTGARRCVARAMPRRTRVVLVGRAEPCGADWQVAIEVGAQRVLTLPEQDDELMAELAGAAEELQEEGSRGAVAAVVAGRGGAGASVFATALALSAPEALLIDVDPWSGGIDLVVGGEAESGLRWPDLRLHGGRLSYGSLRDALPRVRGVTVLSGSRTGCDVDPVPLGAVIDAGSRGGATVVCDVPRRSTAAAETALAAADLAVVLTPADVRSCAAADTVARWVSTLNPNSGVVVRGPAPGGLRSAEVAEIVGLPLLAGMRPQPGVAVTLERGGLRIGRRSPLGRAARRVLTILQQHPAVAA
ncbi:AAA family ATPase [Mycolicibacterium novocastrense]|uniref:septum site-determining protein Ssd n=1 Tax=Mycolicibacterium novocastrense TaxID=59813 RepID=UPI00074766D2|nr:septum site-determining protein Ssd [Mycolicibacterium novocastrense]KUH66033.1 AAA family ATPase [Mycolicibacterium novocastrense]KUH66515.1 AAA family ATPase [Mycolicibacterium novocastrense]KUH74038.1 AAA family ATPase [Mycolicibacterium novocastrense]